MPSHRAEYKSPFGPVEFTPDEQQALRDVVDSFLQSNLEEYEQFIGPANCSLDTRQWELVKEKENVRVFNDRTKRGKELTTTITHGVLKGTLEDFQYAVNCPSTELTLVKSVYIEDRMTDCATLAVIEAPSMEHPFNSMCVKWFIKGQSLLARAIAKNRDLVYIEASRFMTLKSGQRIGAHFFHSIAFPQAPPLKGIIRGNISLCGFTRERGANCVETYVKSQVDGGSAPRPLVVLSTVEAAVSTCHNMHTALMKKLSWCLRRQAKDGARAASMVPTLSIACAVCTTTFSKFSRTPRTCALCRQSICSNCRVKKLLSAFLLDQNDLATMKFSFCVLCVSRVNAMSAVDICRDELMVQDAGLGFGNPSQPSMNSSSGSDDGDSSGSSMAWHP